MPNAGFTLVELLASMAVLGIIVLFLGRLFTSASKSYSSGLKNVEVTANVNAALDVMEKELSQAVFDKSANQFCIYTAQDRANPRQDRLLFIANTGQGDEHSLCVIKYALSDRRTTKENRITERLTRDTKKDVSSDIARTINKDGINDKWVFKKTWGGFAEAILSDVWSFRVDFVANPTYTGTRSTGKNKASSSVDNLTYLFIHIEILDPEVEKRVAMLRDIETDETDALAEEMVKENVKRFSRRIYFNNYNGYYKNDR